MSIKTNILLQSLIFIGLYTFILPLFPDKAVGPYLALNPHDIAKLTFTIMLITSASHFITQITHSHNIILLTGFLGGFSSSTATIVAMASLAKQQTAMENNAAAAAIASSIATYIQVAILIGLVSPAILSALAVPLLAGVGVSIAGCWLVYRGGRRQKMAQTKTFAIWTSLKQGLLLVLILSGMMVFIAALQQRMGHQGLNLASLLSGLVDGHASAIAASEMVVLKKISIEQALIPILIGLTSNTVMRSLLSSISQRRMFILPVAGVLLLANVSAWLGLWLSLWWTV